jgi:ketol-acid reductoisomerase
MDWMYANCSATAQRGALDWKPKFKKAVTPVFRELYKRVKSGQEAKRVLSACGRKDYQAQLASELDVMRNSEMWRAGEATRALRPKTSAKAGSTTAKGVQGRQRG